MSVVTCGVFYPITSNLAKSVHGGWGIPHSLFSTVPLPSTCLCHCWPTLSALFPYNSVTVPRGRDSSGSSWLQRLWQFPYFEHQYADESQLYLLMGGQLVAIPTNLVKGLEAVMGWLKQSQLRINPIMTEVLWPG